MERNIKKRMGVWCAVIAAVLLVPFIANAPWTASDFVFAGVGLFIFALIYEFATRTMNSVTHRLAVGVAVLFGIFLVIGWAASGP